MIFGGCRKSVIFNKIVVGQHDVGRLDIAMHDAVGPCANCSAEQNLLHNAQETGKRKISRLNPAWIAGFLAVDQFHGDVVDAVGFARRHRSPQCWDGQEPWRARASVLETFD